MVEPAVAAPHSPTPRTRTQLHTHLVGWLGWLRGAQLLPLEDFFWLGHGPTLCGRWMRFWGGEPEARATCRRRHETRMCCDFLLRFGAGAATLPQALTFSVCALRRLHAFSTAATRLWWVGGLFIKLPHGMPKTSLSRTSTEPAKSAGGIPNNACCMELAMSVCACAFFIVFIFYRIWSDGGGVGGRPMSWVSQHAARAALHPFLICCPPSHGRPPESAHLPVQGTVCVQGAARSVCCMRVCFRVLRARGWFAEGAGAVAHMLLTPLGWMLFSPQAQVTEFCTHLWTIRWDFAMVVLRWWWWRWRWQSASPTLPPPSEDGERGGVPYLAKRSVTLLPFPCSFSSVALHSCPAAGGGGLA